MAAVGHIHACMYACMHAFIHTHIYTHFVDLMPIFMVGYETCQDICV